MPLNSAGDCPKCKRAGREQNPDMCSDCQQGYCPHCDGGCSTPSCQDDETDGNQGAEQGPVATSASAALSSSSHSALSPSVDQAVHRAACNICGRAWKDGIEVTSPDQAVPASVLEDIRDPFAGGYGADFRVDDDIPKPIRDELMRLAEHKKLSIYYLTAIYRQGRIDERREH